VANLHEVRVPDIGDFKDVEIIEVLVKPGDEVTAEAGLIVLESDKATMEVPAPLTGIVRELKVKLGDRVSEGTVIATMEGAGAPAAAPAPAPTPAPTPAPVATPSPAPAAAAQPARSAATAVVAADAVDEAAMAHVHASPSIRRYARELGIDLGKVKGSGPKGRLLREDINAYVKNLAQAKPAASAPASFGAGLPDWPVIDFEKYGPVEVRALSRIKKISGANLHRNWLAIPHITQQDEADITELEAFRKAMADEATKKGVKLTPLALILKCAAAALKQHPEFNASLEAGGANLILKRYYHIGVAVDTPDGLMVPVIRDVDKKGIFELARELAEVSARAREKKLSAADMQGGTFSISSLGGIGGTYFTPIINAPEVAILGVGRSATRPVYQGNAFVPRLLLPLSLSYDHRVIDGAAGARFITYLGGLLSDIRRLVL
jgi:pyruvate dehydrogenase E2 component (dihydrolipoamide acetyltransferase)